MVLRRLRRLIAHYGGDPRWCLASAPPSGNPGELATRLTGHRPRGSTDDASPRGEKLFALWNPPIVDEETGAAAQRVERGVVADGPARRPRRAHDRVHAVAARRRAAGRVHPAGRARRADPRRASRATERATSPRTGGEIERRARRRRPHRGRLDERAGARDRHRLARRRGAHRLPRARARRCGSRRDGPGGGTATSLASSSPRTIRSTSTWSITLTICSNGRPRRR